MFPQYQLLQIIARDPHILSDLENQLKKAAGENDGEGNTNTKQQLKSQIKFFISIMASTVLLGVQVRL